MAQGTSSDKILEGFLCTVCHKDLRSPQNLLAHFESQHSEDQDLLSSIKDFVGKAKKKILKLDEQDLKEYKEEIQEKYYLSNSEPQQPGQTRVHTEHFRTLRREHLDHRTSETNNLIIRLYKLLACYDGSDRKQHEQKIVTWLDGTTVTRCPSCAASFNITRRQHHCRLCGSIMCNTCSYFLPYKVAQTLVSSMRNTTDTPYRETQSKTESESIRICYHCRNTLEYRRRIQIDQLVQPIICQLYSLLQKLKSQVQPGVELYLKMYNSLISGETTYQLQDVQNLRTTIGKQAKMMETVGKKIASLPVDPENPKTATLQTNIKRATSYYINEHLISMPVLPTMSELEQMQRDRILRTTSVEEMPKTNVRVTKVAVETGWTPAGISKDDAEEPVDPLLEQINNVKHYIEQAKVAQRFTEVLSLKENLRTLQKEYEKQQRYHCVDA